MSLASWVLNTVESVKAVKRPVNILLCCKGRWDYCYKICVYDEHPIAGRDNAEHPIAGQDIQHHYKVMCKHVKHPGSQWSL